MRIHRINGADDPRFPREVLWRHAAYEADGQPCWWTQTGRDTAVLHGQVPADADALVEEIRFHAGHLTRFLDEQGNELIRLPEVALFHLALAEIQPSQFLVDADKLRAVQSFVRDETDVLIPLSPYGARYLAQDGHTRLKAAQLLGLTHVWGYVAEDGGDYLSDFAAEAQKRGVYTVQDMPVIDHADYQLRWNEWCERFFASRQQGQ